jgi:uncharacterized protein YkwD
MKKKEILKIRIKKYLIIFKALLILPIIILNTSPINGQELPSFTQQKKALEVDNKSLIEVAQGNMNNFRQLRDLNQPLNLNNPDLKSITIALVYVVNEKRAENNLSSLKESKILNNSATMHSQDMMEGNFFEHYNPLDKKKETPNQRVKLFGGLNPAIAENIATGFAIQYKANTPYLVNEAGDIIDDRTKQVILVHTPLSLADALVENWMNSPGHRKNILNPNALEIGHGLVFVPQKNNQTIPKVLVTQNFQLFNALQTSP